MIPRALRNNRGIALLITLSVVTIVVTITLELNRNVRSSVISMGTGRDRFTLSHMATSGINAAMAMLAKDRKVSITDTLQEDWANPEKIAELLQDIPFEEGDVSVRITDELGKIQLNALAVFPGARQFNEAQRQLWDRFLYLAISQDESLEEIEPSMIINSAKDWMDSGDDDAITGLNGAEIDHYEVLDPPYACKNDRFAHISELLLVRGVTPDLFYLLGGSQGISDYLTVYGLKETGKNSFTYEGKVNISTAELPVLAAILPLGYEELAGVLYEYRIEMSESEYIHDLSRPAWYKTVPGFGDVKINEALITTRSDIFRIEAMATLNEVTLTITTIVQRVKDKNTRKWVCKVLNWQVE